MVRANFRYMWPHLTSGLKPKPTYGEIKPYPEVLPMQQQRRPRKAAAELVTV